MILKLANEVERLRAELASAERECSVRARRELGYLARAQAAESALAAQPQAEVQPSIGVQACRPEDRAMLATPVGAELVAKVAQAIAVPTAVATAPERIWLQIGDDRDCMDEPFPGDEVTWCADSVLGAEVEYVRADLAAAQSNGWKACVERNAEIVRRRKAGETLAAIARSYGLSREHVRRVVATAERREASRGQRPA
jgi:hypothetical protein